MRGHTITLGYMFVAVATELSSDDQQIAVDNMLTQYGFKKIHERLYESVTITDQTLLRLKRDIDHITDYYDSVRFYQYPMDDVLVITHLQNKKWRRTVVYT